MIDKKAILGKSQIKGQVGENAVWDGPLSKVGFPMGKGSSSGANGMEISKADCGCGSYKLPITQRAKGQM
tara:strand:- start:78 stop:287 length:210 start_codon:yes stop_codon:yes gene_type:complete